MWGYEQFVNFVAKWEKKYQALKKYSQQRNIAYFTYMDFPTQVQRFIYTTNWIERLNRKYKRTMKMRNAMPSSQAVLFLLLSQWRKQIRHIKERYINLNTGKKEWLTKKQRKEKRVAYTLFRTVPEICFIPANSKYRMITHIVHKKTYFNIPSPTQYHVTSTQRCIKDVAWQMNQSFSGVH